MERKLRVGIDCRIRNSQQGIGTAVLALAKALSESNSASQEYTFIVHDDMQGWLAPYVYGAAKLAAVPAPAFTAVKTALYEATKPLRSLLGNLRNTEKRAAASDGYLERRNFDVVHFPTQVACLTNIPSIYQPWDLQHLHYPQFFTAEEFERREREYRAFCGRAAFVCVQAEWTRQDLIQNYGITPEKVVLVPWGPVFDAYSAPSAEDKQTALRKYSIPQQFFLYPAATWPHKNHEVIFRALKVLETGSNLSPHVYFTGSSTNHRPTLDQLAREQAHFLGFLTPEHLQAIFSEATAMIFASKFEGFGLPILEAFHAKLPVLCSNATTLPEVAQDGALYFDPDSPGELAGLMKALLNAPELRQDLISKGTSLLSRYSIHDTAAGLQKLYERTAAAAPDVRRLPVSSATV